MAKKVDYDRSPEAAKAWTSEGYYSNFGTTYIYIRCPHCNGKTRAYVWSLAGSGKKCNDCGAMFTSFGQAWPVKK